MMFLLTVTVTSLLLAVILSVIAWRVAGDERRRSEARVAALSAEIHDVAAASAFTAPLGRARNDPAYSRFLAVIAGGALVFAAVVVMAIVFTPRVTRAARPPAAPIAAAAPAALPLDLVELAHERDGDRLIVRGVVRNPPSGAARDRVTAVVQLFTADGVLLSGARADLASPSLLPGDQSTFAVALPGADAVGRYRISFKADEIVVPHVDRRHDER